MWGWVWGREKVDLGDGCFEEEEEAKKVRCVSVMVASCGGEEIRHGRYSHVGGPRT
jgi:hypothetical protein